MNPLRRPKSFLALQKRLREEAHKRHPGEKITDVIDENTKSPFTYIAAGGWCYWYNTPDNNTHVIVERFLKDVDHLYFPENIE